MGKTLAEQLAEKGIIGRNAIEQHRDESEIAKARDELFNTPYNVLKDRIISARSVDEFTRAVRDLLRVCPENAGFVQQCLEGFRQRRMPYQSDDDVRKFRELHTRLTAICRLLSLCPKDQMEQFLTWSFRKDD